MATCIRCGHGWNSWGSNDQFCSEKCEQENKAELTDKIWDLHNKLSDTQINILKSIINLSIGDEHTAINVMSEVFNV
jgi:hypothetical protein